MPAFRPTSRRNLIKYLQQLGFEGPFSGSKHEFMLRNGKRLTIPNPHKGDISIRFLNELLKEAGISRKKWEDL